MSQVDRDQFLEAVQTLFGHEPADYDGMTLAEISQEFGDNELHEIYHYLGVE